MNNKEMPHDEELRELFDYLLELFGDLSFHTESEDGEDYLHKSERLGNLAREKFKKRQSQWLDGSEEKLFGFKPDNISSYPELISRINRVFTRPLLRSMKEEGDEAAVVLEDIVKSRLGSSSVQIHLSVTPFDESLYRKFLMPCITKKARTELDKATEQIVFITVSEEDFEPIKAFGFKNIPHHQKSVRFKDGSYAVDIADVISGLIVWRYVSDMLGYYHAYRNGNYEPTASDVSVFERIEDCKKTLAERYLRVPGVFIHFPATWHNSQDFSILSTKQEATLYVKDSAVDSWPDFADFCKSKGFTVKEHYNFGSKGLEKEETPSISVHYPLAMDAVLLLIMLDEYSHVPYHAFLRMAGIQYPWYYAVLQGCWSIRGAESDTDIMGFLSNTFLQIACTKREIATEMSYYKDMEVEHARSFETKKNISAKVLAEMEASDFNNYFGFVEFDTEVDIAKAREIAKEFRAVKEKYLSKFNLSENQLRFRKLGNHKAVGLYYPMLKCLCVDITCPRSFIHELGHLIDYAGGESDSKAFYPIKSAYIRHIDKEMADSASFKSRMKGGTKYSYSYFTTPTEIFARAFELYFAVCLGVSASIAPVPTELDKGVYPMDDETIALIKTYFDSLLEIEEVKEIAEAV